MKTKTLRSLGQFAVAILMVIVLLGVPGSARAALVIEVDTPTDPATGTPTTCSLRQAIQAANTNTAVGKCIAGSATGTDYIHLPANTYQLTLQPRLEITSSVAIYGDSPDTTIIDAKGLYRVFTVTSPSEPVSFTNITITGGKATDTHDGSPNGYGGGILVQNLLTTTPPSVVYLNLVKITGNTAELNGGGIQSTIRTIVNIDQTEIYNNTAGNGSGIAVDGTMTVNRSSVYNNTALTAAAINSNSQYNLYGDYTQIIDTTIANNNAGVGQAAGILVSGLSKTMLLNDTIVDNKGIGLDVNLGGTGWMKNTILARQVSGTTVYNNCILRTSQTQSTQFVSAGHNLVSFDLTPSTTSCGFNKTGDLQVARTALGLGTFGLYEGATQLYPLNPYINATQSPAVDTGDNNGCPAIDQRYYSRPVPGITGSQTAICDIGSYELAGLPLNDHTYLPSLSR